MKQLSFTFLFCLMILASHAQTVIDTVQYRIHYAVKMQMSKEHYWVKNDDEINLDIGKNRSLCYSRWYEGNLAIADSVRAEGGSYQDVASVQEKRGFPTAHFMQKIVKNYPKTGRCTVRKNIFKTLQYEEDMLTPEWQPLPGDTIIEGYACQRAVTTLRGKTWQVWYTSDIPISDGPLKLYGLPGLILKAEDTEHEFAFSCIGIESHVDQPMRLRDKQFVKTTPQEVEKIEILSGKDVVAMWKLMGGGNAQHVDGTQLVMPSYTPCLWEYYETK